jgi:hypothetical protein
MQSVQVQDYLFQRIRERLPAGASLADELSNHLFISPDSAYRRIRGETPLVLEEAMTLCNAYGISLDEAMQAGPHSVAFNFVGLDSSNHAFRNYLEGIRDGLKQLAAAREQEVIYMSKDIPVFYNFLFAPLFSFRFFFWMKSIIRHPDYVNRPYDRDCLPQHIAALGREINLLYASIPSIEIWNTEAVNSTISQVEYYREAGYFSSAAESEEIYVSLRQLLAHLQVQAECGTKFIPGENVKMRKDNYQMYYNRVALGDNTIMAIMDGKKIVYLGYDILDYMVTMDTNFCDRIYHKMQTMTRRSTILSNESEKQRSIFLNILLKKIPSRMANLNNNGQ